MFNALILTFVNYFADSFFDITEKYLLENYSINPFQVLFYEGVFGLILSCIYIFFENPLTEITDIYNEKKENFIWLIFLLLL